jgi:hypothetical protein
MTFAKAGSLQSALNGKSQLYRLIQTKEWVSLIDVIHKNSRDQSFLKNQSIVNSLQIFEMQFCEDLENSLKNANSQSVLEIVFQLHRGKTYKLSEHTFTQVVAKLAKIYEQQGSRKEAVTFAKICPNNPICAEIIKSYEESATTVVEHSQRYKIQVTTNETIISPNFDYTISLFRSKQEKNFFDAVRDIYQSFTIYPNVALSCVIDKDKIEPHLSEKECWFFLTSSIDCVVFDNFNNYKPILFFELDSDYHNTPKQIKNDGWKDKILGIAGHKLRRIRKIDQNQDRDISKEEFIELIREII